MSNTLERLNEAYFPGEYADILTEVLTVTQENFLSVKDALYHFRAMNDDQAGEVIQRMAAEFAAAIIDGRDRMQEAGVELEAAAESLRTHCVAGTCTRKAIRRLYEAQNLWRSALSIAEGK
jgi:hypothetical protein